MADHRVPVVLFLLSLQPFRTRGRGELSPSNDLERRHDVPLLNLLSPWTLTSTPRRPRVSKSTLKFPREAWKSIAEIDWKAERELKSFRTPCNDHLNVITRRTWKRDLSFLVPIDSRFLKAIAKITLSTVVMDQTSIEGIDFSLLLDNGIDNE